MPVHPFAPYEVVLAGALQGTVNAGTAATVTVTVNEPGLLDMARGVLAVAGDTQLAESPRDLTPWSRIQAITLNGSVLFLRGRNTPGAPGSVLWGARQTDIVRLPRVRVTTGDVITVTILYRATGGKANGMIMFPLAVDRLRGKPVPAVAFQNGEVLTGSAEATPADETATTVTMTFDTSGWIDASRICFNATQDIQATIRPITATWLYGIRSLQLRTSDVFIVGSGTDVQMPMSAFAGDRQFNFVNLGWHSVTAGDTMTATVYGKLGIAALSCNFSVPLVPLQGPAVPTGKDEMCIPC
jgi:hypothetical protein